MLRGCISGSGGVHFGQKKAPGKNTRGVLIKVFLTIKPYPMKRQNYVGLPGFARIGPMVINTLGTYFKKTLVNHLKIFGPGVRLGFFNVRSGADRAILMFVPGVRLGYFQVRSGCLFVPGADWPIFSL